MSENYYKLYISSGIFKLMLVLMFFILMKNETYSIPAFARKYKTSCATCHIAVSKRNAFGEAFRRNGYVMTKRNAQMIKEQPLKLGADAWKEMWPEAIWPSDIPGSFPIAAYTQMRMEYDVNQSITGHHFDFNMPYDFSLMFGGAFGEDIGFFGSWSSVFGFNRMFFILNDFIGPKDLFNLKIGYFQPGISDGYPDNQRLTMEHTSVLGYSSSGDWSPYLSQAGLELNGIMAHRFQYSIGILNGEGKTKADINDNKDYYARIAYKIGGYGLDGDGLMLDSGQTDYWTDNSLTVGIYSYFGNSQKTDSNQSFNNQFNRYGIDIRYKYGDLDLLAGVMAGTDDRPQLNNRELNSILGFIESDYIIYPWLIGIIRLEYIDAKYENSISDAYSWNKTYRIIPNICVLFRQNVRFSIESLINIQGDKVVLRNTVSADNSQPFQWIKINSLFAF